MAAVAGILFTEALGLTDHWWRPDGAAHIGPDGLPTPLVYAEATFMAVVESLRLASYAKDGPGAKACDARLRRLCCTEESLQRGLFPCFFSHAAAAQAFDPANMRSQEGLTKEIKNGAQRRRRRPMCASDHRPGRLAMVAFLGMTSQAAVRGMGPLACLQAHLADPGHVNLFTSSVGAEACIAVCAASLAPIALIAQKHLKAADDKEEFRPIPW